MEDIILITITDLSVQFSDRILFEDVNLQFTPGNCYGIIGANGAGKSTFLKVLSEEIEPTQGYVHYDKGVRIATLKQNHFDYDDYTVLETVLMGYPLLYQTMKDREAIYEKSEFTEEDGLRAAELEATFAELNGWEAEVEAAMLLQGLNIDESLHHTLMSQLASKDKIKVLLAQSLFGKPDVLLLDEPTNGLDVAAKAWLEEFLINFENTVLVVSHDRHFLNRVCTHIVDVDFQRIQIHVGNYDFWRVSSELAAQLQADQRTKQEEKRKELQDFIARFQANASKSKQATSRKKMLEKLTIEEIKPSSRKYPFIRFTPEREIGNDLLQVDQLSAHIDGRCLFSDISFTLNKEDKVAFFAQDERTISLFFDILCGDQLPDSGTIQWGTTTSRSRLPRDFSKAFQDPDQSILNWLQQFVTKKEEEDVTFLRGFLGRMLFSGDDVHKPIRVLSGGEKVRCLLAKMMLSKANVLLMDDPTNHLDLESITALNEGMEQFPGSILFYSHDQELLQTVANRIIVLTPNGVIDRLDTTYDAFIQDEALQKQIITQYK